MPSVDFEARWAVIEAFIEAEAVNPDPAVVAAMRESVRYGEAPELHGIQLSLPSVAGPGPGIPASAGPGPGIPTSAGPGPGIPAIAGPGPGIPLVFVSDDAAEEAHDMMEDLAEDMMIEDD